MDEYSPRRKAKDWQNLAEQRLQQLREEQPCQALHPIQVSTRKLATQVWGSAWMRQLAYCEQQEGLQLAAGRSLLRHGCVLDIQMRRGEINAIISGEELYDVSITLAPLEEEELEQWQEHCRGHLDSYLSLLEGKISPALLEHLCQPEEGILPRGQDWHFSCTCPDWSSPCSHAAAALYAAGCLIDQQAEKLFELRGLSAEQLLSQPSTPTEGEDRGMLSSIFGIELD